MRLSDGAGASCCRCRRARRREAQLLKLPNILSREARPFDPETFADEGMDEESNAHLRLENVIRWRDVDGERQSNTRPSSWRPTTMTLHVGSEVLSATSQPLGKRGAGQEAQPRPQPRPKGATASPPPLREYFLVQPTSTKSETHKALTKQIAKSHVKERRIKVVTTAEDPEKKKADDEKAWRQSNQLASAQEARRQRYSSGPELTEDFLEADDESQLDGNLGALKRGYKADLMEARRRRRARRARLQVQRARSNRSQSERDEFEDEDEEDEEDAWDEEEKRAAADGEMDDFIVGASDEEESPEESDEEEYGKKKKPLKKKTTIHMRTRCHISLTTPRLSSSVCICGGLMAILAAQRRKRRGGVEYAFVHDARRRSPSTRGPASDPLPPHGMVPATADLSTRSQYPHEHGGGCRAASRCSAPASSATPSPPPSRRLVNNLDRFSRSTSRRAPSMTHAALRPRRSRLPPQARRDFAERMAAAGMGSRLILQI